MDTITATKHWNKAGTKATVVVDFGDGDTISLGGNRAARATAVIIVQRTEDSKPGVIGLRADAWAAAKEAGKYLATTRRHHGHDFPQTPAFRAFALVIEVAS